MLNGSKTSSNCPVCEGKKVTQIDKLNLSIQFGDDDYDNMGDDDYDDFSKELNQYKKSKDRGRGKFRYLPIMVFYEVKFMV